MPTWAIIALIWCSLVVLLLAVHAHIGGKNKAMDEQVERWARDLKGGQDVL